MRKGEVSWTERRARKFPRNPLRREYGKTKNPATSHLFQTQLRGRARGSLARAVPPVARRTRVPLLDFGRRFRAVVFVPVARSANEPARAQSDAKGRALGEHSA